jgi:hypothetical protein
MQRRAAGAYGALFFVLAAGAYLLAGTQYAAMNNAVASLWGIVILAGITFIILTGMAYLPVRG